MLHPYDVCADCIGLEDMRHHSTHRAVGWCIGEGFSRHDVPVLVNHVGGDGKRLISTDSSAEWCDDQVGWCTGRNGDVLRTTNKSKAG